MSIADVMHMLKRGKLPHQRRREYYRKRGMSLGHDAHDWLGGFPYESANLQELEAAMAHLGFELINSHDARGGRLALGIMGTGCASTSFARASVAVHRSLIEFGPLRERADTQFLRLVHAAFVRGLAGSSAVMSFRTRILACILVRSNWRLLL
jgi:hypothetical protein